MLQHLLTSISRWHSAQQWVPDPVFFLQNLVNTRTVYCTSRSTSRTGTVSVGSTPAVTSGHEPRQRHWGCWGCPPSLTSSSFSFPQLARLPLLQVMQRTVGWRRLPSTLLTGQTCPRESRAGVSPTRRCWATATLGSPSAAVSPESRHRSLPPVAVNFRSVQPRATRQTPGNCGADPLWHRRVMFRGSPTLAPRLGSASQRPTCGR